MTVEGDRVIPGLDIGTMSAADVDLVIEWAAREGWNPGHRDAAAFRSVDPEGFVMGRVDGEPVSAISVVRYPGSFAFLGLYIVVPEWRGRGVGWATWQAGLVHAADDVIGLDGVVDQQANYARSGFVLAHRNIRFGGVPRPVGEPAADVLTLDDLDEVAAYDLECFGFPRRAFLAAWLSMPGALAAGVRVGGRLAGYGVIRPCRTGFKIAPLFADDTQVATAVWSRLVAHAGPAAEVFLDVPEPHGAAVDLASRAGLAPVFETARMYRGAAPSLPLDRIVGITTFELG